MSAVGLSNSAILRLRVCPVFRYLLDIGLVAPGGQRVGAIWPVIRAKDGSDWWGVAGRYVYCAIDDVLGISSSAGTSR